jgi:hypothetical protein
MMPFGETFDTVWKDLIAPPLERAGYEAVRADSELAAGNILKGIVQEIMSARLLVVDLTAHNPNVFYELGLAHGLGLPALLLTQSLQSLPFDLKGYRVIEYSTQFDRVSELTTRLESVARQHLAGELQWSDPVKDFGPDPVSVPTLGPSPSDAVPQIVSDIAASSYRRLHGFADQIGLLADAAIKVGGELDAAEGELEPLQAAATSPTGAQAQARVSKLSGPLEAYLASLSIVAPQFRSGAGFIPDACENLVLAARQLKTVPGERQKLLSVLSGIGNIASAVQSISSGIEAMNAALAKVRGYSPVVDELSTKVLEGHEPVLSTAASALAALYRTSLVLDQELAPTRDELERLRSPSVAADKEGGEVELARQEDGEGK